MCKYEKQKGELFGKTHHVSTSKGQVLVIGEAYRTNLHLIRDDFELRKAGLEEF